MERLDYDKQEYVPFSDLLGQTLVAIEKYEDYLIFRTKHNEYHMYHDQDCCESVTIESVVGDMLDLIGEPILKAEEAVSQGSENPEDEWSDSCTWTFYKLATIKGYVDIRWYGTSNGYYSERVSFYRKKK